MLGGEYSSRYNQIQLIGRNPQDDSQMHLVQDITQGQYRMSKKLNLSTDGSSDQNQMINEVTLLKQLQHPHILKYYDIYLEEDCLISILQFCEEGDLYSYMQKKKNKKQSFSQKLLLSWLMQLLMGMQYVHSKHIVHRLICNKNVYLNHQGDLKIGSFGSAKEMQNTMQKAMTLVSQPCYMSPEIIQSDQYNSKADIWAIGCLIYELAALKPLYNFTNLNQLFDLIVEKPSPELPTKYGKYLNPIYKKMMKKNPNHRPSASQLLQQQVFIQLMRQYIKKKKIDSLDLKYLVPKKLVIHKNKNSANKKENIKLPPISPTLSPRTNSTMKKTVKTQRAASREGHKILNSQVEENSKRNQNIEAIKRVSKINQEQGKYISYLCEAKLGQILEKYKPNMSQICQRTFQFEDF